jgi:RimJ/RimL family protein N-acetyltransferase
VHERRRRRCGYAPWTVVTRADRRIVGWGGLYDDPFEPGWGVEVGYWFHPQAWGRGYASELVRASLAFADDGLGLDDVKAFARPQNAASRRVLEKAGFQPVAFVPKLERLLFCRRRAPRRMLG